MQYFWIILGILGLGGYLLLLLVMKRFQLEVHRLSVDNRHRPIIGQFADNRYRPFDNWHQPIIGIGR